MKTATDKQATPLLLPNNYKWDDKTGLCTKIPGMSRVKLVVIPQALALLREIKGPVYVVAITGARRSGKSYILSQAFDQEEVFKLGHHTEFETVGVWLWIVPKKFKDSVSGQEFTVVLLDSEGSDLFLKGFNGSIDVFALIFLLSSILIYNSIGVPSKSDLKMLDSMVKLSWKIHIYASGTDGGNEIAPSFIWLLRDMMLQFPNEFENLREYFVQRVFKEDAISKESREAGLSISDLLSDFDAFSLPLPALDPEALANLNRRKNEAIPKFWKQLDSFKTTLQYKLTSKMAYKKGKIVTGEGLAAMVESYVKALNNPDIVQNKCKKILAEAVNEYKQEMISFGRKVTPCEHHDVLVGHNEAMAECAEKFQKDTSGCPIKPDPMYLKEMQLQTDEILYEVLQLNKQRTQEYCSQLMKDLEKHVLDPVIASLRSTDGHKMDFNEVMKAYYQLHQRYYEESRGDLFTKKATWFDEKMKIHEEFEKMKQRQEMKDQVTEADKGLEDKPKTLHQAAEIERQELLPKISPHSLQYQIHHQILDRKEILVDEHAGSYDFPSFGLFLHVPDKAFNKISYLMVSHLSEQPFSPAKEMEDVVSLVLKIESSAVLQKPVVATILHCGLLGVTGYENVVMALDANTQTWEQLEEIEERSVLPEDGSTNFIQVLPVPRVLHKDLADVRLSPMLIVDGFDEITFSKDVIVTLPRFYPPEEPKSQMRVMCFKDNKWREITERVHCEMSESAIEMRINHFSKIEVFIGYLTPLTFDSVYRWWTATPRHVMFSAFIMKDVFDCMGEFKITLACFPSNLKKEMEKSYLNASYAKLGGTTSTMKVNEEAKVETEGDFIPIEESDVILEMIKDGCEKELNLKNNSAGQTSVKIRLKFHSQDDNRDLGSFVIYGTQLGIKAARRNSSGPPAVYGN